MVVIAHGLLGPYDELIYLGVAVIFLAMMIISWFQTRMTEYDDDRHLPDDAAPSPEPPQERNDDRFTLD
ncbi:MAG: hypothetical protein ACOYL5_15480 [Phototrophicaceae bacterium]|jgi:hypothetical protein